jgi:hypothetical protein
MMLVVLIAGIGLLVAGLVTVGLGIELDLSFGNTLVLAGAIMACTGVLMLGLWGAVRELKAIARQLSGLPAPSRSAGSSAAQGDLAAEDAGMLFSRDQQTLEPALPAEPATSAAPPWQEEAASRDRGRGEAPAPSAKPRRNLLFSSSSRREREPAEAPAIPPLEESNPPPPASFEDAWPRPDRARTPDVPRRGARAPLSFTEPGAGADQIAPAERSEDQPEIRVLKSGVVDGMAYSLYSDGSIEAQMPEGMMRFASIDELRAHLDQRP